MQSTQFYVLLNCNQNGIYFTSYSFCIGESPRICPFLKHYGDEAPKELSPIIFQECKDRSTFSDLKHTSVNIYNAFW